MGNRAVITTEDRRIGIYVHWNGGRNSIVGFLTFCKLKGYRDPSDDNYGWARLCQCIGNFFGEECDVGIDTLDHLDCDNWDNGMYIIKNWEIIGKEYSHSDETVDMKAVRKMVEYINSNYAESDRIPQGVIDEYFSV